MLEEWIENIESWLHVQVLCMCEISTRGARTLWDSQHCIIATAIPTWTWLLPGTLISFSKAVLSFLVMVPTAAAMTFCRKENAAAVACCRMLSHAVAFWEWALHHQHMISYDVHLHPLHIHPKCYGLWFVSVNLLKNVFASTSHQRSCMRSQRRLPRLLVLAPHGVTDKPSKKS